MLWLLAPALAADGWTVRAGGHVDAAFHGVLDVAWRRGPWTLGLYTDTLEARYAPSGGRGRAWVAARGELGVAGLMTSPWTDGAPDPGHARSASYAGLEGGAVRYGAEGLYAGGQAAARWWMQRPLETTTIPLPPDHPVLTAEAIAGVWRPELRAWGRAGVDLEGGAAQPHAAIEFVATPRGGLAPRIEVRAGVAEGQTDVTKTRLGGLSPYGVPLAGAAWAEWWVEDYVATRGGLVGRRGPWEVSGFVDAAALDGSRAAGIGTEIVWRSGPWTVDTSVGVSPWLTRREGAPVSGWARVGWER